MNETTNQATGYASHRIWCLSQVNILNGITISSAAFAGLTVMTNRQDRQTTLLCL